MFDTFDIWVLIGMVITIWYQTTFQINPNFKTVGSTVGTTIGIALNILLWPISLFTIIKKISK